MYPVRAWLMAYNLTERSAFDPCHSTPPGKGTDPLSLPLPKSTRATAKDMGIAFATASAVTTCGNSPHVVTFEANAAPEGIPPAPQEPDTLIKDTTLSTDADAAAAGAGVHDSQNSDNKTKDQPSTSHLVASTPLTSFPPASLSSLSSSPPVDLKKGLYPRPQQIPEPQLLTLRPAFYQPKEFNSFDHPASPPLNNDFDISSPGATTTSASNMIFTELYRSRRATLSKKRNSQIMNTTANDASTEDFDPNLLSRDKSKQREAIRKHLAKNVKNDWNFKWTRTDVPALPVVVRRQVANGVVTEVRYHDPDTPKPASTTSLAQVLQDRKVKSPSDETPITSRDSGEEPDSGEENEDGADDDDNESVYSILTEDESQFKPRLEWDSEFSAIDSILEPVSKEVMESASPDELMLINKERRRKAIKEEMTWNQGLACFETRRNQWTCARVARLRPKPTPAPAMSNSPPPHPSTSPRSPRRLFFRHSIHSTTSPISPTSTNATSINSDSDAAANSASKASIETGASHPTTATDDSKRASLASNHDVYPIETLLPIAPPLLPPQNPMRASITPKLYLALYDRTITQSMTPSCPINLADMLPACVAGWMRDGEWPPKTVAPPPPPPARKTTDTSPASRRRSFGFLTTREDEGAGASKGFRRGIQKVLGLGGGPVE
ncbi:hypothetical protein BROUX41_004288 [Berkeleyomyces rouxiae]|uniref:uncharacterized protein n=1 Tax=Berkeleyomyces rouxiae TaxID=2035830 RepID=UPI003B783ACA